MKYETVLQTIKNILENDLIEKEGLTLNYTLDKDALRQLDEEVYIQIHGHINGHERSDELEVELGGILLKFTEKNLEL